MHSAWLSEWIVYMWVLPSNNLPSLTIITVIEFNQNVIHGYQNRINPPTNYYSLTLLYEASDKVLHCSLLVHKQ